MAEVTIRLYKFNEISKRKDIKNPTWFAIDNDIFTHPDFFKINGDEFKCWVWILSVASKINRDTVRLDSEVFAHQAKSKESIFFSTLKKLDKKRLEIQEHPASVTDANGSVRDTNASVSYTTLQDTTEQNTTGHNITQHNTTISTVVEPTTRGPLMEFQNFNIEIDNFLANVTHKLQKSWLNLYEQDFKFIRIEILKAVSWEHANPKKVSKDKGRFMTNWLARAHESQRKGIPSRRMTNSEVNAQSLNELYNKAMNEEKDVTGNN